MLVVAAQTSGVSPVFLSVIVCWAVFFKPFLVLKVRPVVSGLPANDSERSVVLTTFLSEGTICRFRKLLCPLCLFRACRIYVPAGVAAGMGMLVSKAP